MVGRTTAVLLLLALTGCHGCARQSAPDSTPAPTTTTTPAPVVEETISANSAPNQERGNAWSSGGGIDWTHVGPGGQSGGSNRGTSSSGSRRGSSGSTGSTGSSSASASSGSSGTASASRGELRRLSQDLFNADTNAVGSQVTLHTQGRTSSSALGDNAAEPLIAIVSPQVLRGATIAPFWALLDNYSPSVTVREQQTSQERQEEEAFLSAVMATEVMTKTEQFLRQKGFIRTPLKDVLREIWFTPYTRSRRTVGSSGFEHVFVGELKDGKVSGFHNWLSYYKEEQEGDLDYLGYMRTVDLGPKAKLVLLKFNWSGDVKPVGSMFVGTSPELEMALFTVCYFARPGNNCPMEISGNKFNIKTYSQTYNGRTYVGTAFPNI